jgi:hypothetical protein
MAVVGHVGEWFGPVLFSIPDPSAFRPHRTSICLLFPSIPLVPRIAFVVSVVQASKQITYHTIVPSPISVTFPSPYLIPQRPEPTASRLFANRGGAHRCNFPLLLYTWNSKPAARFASTHSHVTLRLGPTCAPRLASGIRGEGCCYTIGFFSFSSCRLFLAVLF